MTFTLQLKFSKDLYILEYSSIVVKMYWGAWKVVLYVFLWIVLCGFVSAVNVEIYDCDDLQNMNQNLSGSYELANDIDCSATRTWGEGKGFNPIGNLSERFTGYFDGKNHLITGLYMNRSESYIGLFGYVQHATIKNVGFIDVAIYADPSSGDDIGALIGRAEWVNVTNSYSSGLVKGRSNVGGLIGSLYDYEVRNSHSNATVIGSYMYVGGLVGSFTGSIIDSYAIGTVDSPYYAAGLIGKAGKGNSGNNLVYNCSAAGDVSRRYYNCSHHCGGLIGTSEEIMVEKSYATGDVNAKPDQAYMGGLIALASKTNISQSYAIGDVIGDSFVGGLVGSLQGSYANETLKDSYATGNIYTTGGNGLVGGLVGQLHNTNVINSYATGTVNARSGGVGGLIGTISNYSVQPVLINSYSTGYVGGDDVGGLIGRVDSNFSRITNVYYYGNVSDCCGLGSCIDCTREVSSDVFYGNEHDVYVLSPLWDFIHIWQNHSDDYPTLRLEKPLDVDSLLEKYAPVLYLHPDEEFFPKSIYSMLNESDLMLGNRSIDVSRPVSQDNLDGKENGSYLDMQDASPGFFPSVPNSSRFDRYENTVYGRVFEPDDEHIVLQYWFFYPYNHFRGGHEGDWEMIQIILNKTDEKPLTSTYSYHYDGRTYNWSDINKVDSTHPKVFVAEGGHASYKDPVVIWLPGYLLLESVSEENNSIVYYCNNTDTSQFVNNRSTQYRLNSILNATEWAHFNGRWGESKNKSSIYNGPSSPANLRYGNQAFRWNDPIGFANNPSPDSTSAATGSPVNLHAYDSQGRHVGLSSSGDIEAEIPGVYMYIPSDDEKEVIVILDSEDLTFEIEATDQGEFDFSLNTQNDGNYINLQYEDVQINKNTRATMQFTNTNPNFIMGIDVNGDGITDTTLSPNNVEISGNYSNNETDFDNDSIADSIDNCINTSNPDQRDWDNDSVGDVCDVESINITLVPGWNLISIPLIANNNSIPSLIPGYLKAFTYLQGSLIELNDGSHVNTTWGMWVEMLNNNTITINGTLPRNPLFMMKQGWNLIGYPSLIQKEVNKTFNVSQIESVFMYNASNTLWKSYNPLNPLNTLESMKYGYGYLVKVNDTMNWTFNGEFK